MKAGEKNEEKSCYSASYGGGGIGIGYIKSIDDILADIPLRNVCLKIIERFGELKRGHTYATDIIEADEQGSYQPYELILLFKEFGLVEKIDREGFYNQTKYKAVGKRRLEFTLNADKVLDFIDRTNGKQSIIKKKALEFIARRIGEMSTGNELIDFFKGLGVPECLIVYPNTKWVMVYDILLYYASSSDKKKHQKLFRILEDICHPLMHGGDEKLAQETANLFNSYLSYDKICIDFDEKERAYRCSNFRVPSEDEKQEILIEIYEEEERRYKLLRENKEKISIFRKSYQSLMGLAEIFCNNFQNLKHEEIVELNKYYLHLCNTLNKIYIELKLYEVLDGYKNYQKPFENLFSAEKELKGSIVWDVVRREMSAVFGEIETLYHKIEASDVLTEPDTQESLNKIQLYLSNLKKKNDTKNKALKDKNTEKSLVQKIEIVNPIKILSGENSKDKLKLKIHLENTTIDYDDNKPSIKIGKKEVALPPYKNEHFLCRAMYEYRKGEAVDWSIIWEKMTGYDENPDKPEPQKSDWHSVYDTMRALNKRIQECISTDNFFLVWKEQTITRNY